MRLPASVWLLLFAVAVAITISRRPDAFLNAQFWAEDGAVWYRDAYTLGWLPALLIPRDGYFQTLSRLTAALAQPLPLAAAPYLFNLVGLVWQVLPALYLASPRFATLLPSLPARLLLAFIYLVLPNGAEVHVNVTNAQSHLAMLGLMIILAPPAGARWSRIVDVLILTLACLTTIMCVLLVPVAAFVWRARRRAWCGLLFLLVLSTGVVQLVGLGTGVDTRSNDPLGASIELFFRILGGQVVLSPLLGARGYDWVLTSGRSWVVPLAAAVGVLVLGYAALRGPLELRLLLGFAAGILAVALLRGNAHSAGSGVWAVLTLPEAGARYFFFPTLAFIASLLWVAARGTRPLRLLGYGLLGLLLFVGIPLDWRLEPLTDLRFGDYARRFEQAPRGTRLIIPLNPPGSAMELVKR